MRKIADEVLAANAGYAADLGDQGSLPVSPGGHFMIPARTDAGLTQGDSRVIRRAGGRASEDIGRIRNNPLVPDDFRSAAVSTTSRPGRLGEVRDAAAAGRSSR